MRDSTKRHLDVVLRLLRHRAYANAYNVLAKLHPADIADLYSYLNDEEKAWFAESAIKGGQLVAIISELGAEHISEFFAIVPETVLFEALRQLQPDDLTDTLAALSPERQEIILNKLGTARRQETSKLLGYAPDTAGGIMNTDFVALPETMLVEEAINQLRQQTSTETFYVYVIDKNERLVGVVSFRDLVVSAPAKSLAEIMKKDPVSVEATTNQAEVADIIARYDLLSLPVVDTNYRLIGRVTVDDAIDVIEEEATQDIYRLASLSAEEHVSTPILTAASRRAPWLLINLGTALLAAGVVAYFQDTISQYVVLAAMMPIVAGMGGNAGTQSLAVVVRALALGEIDWTVGARVILKEVGIGVLNGGLNGFVMAIIAWAWYRNLALAALMFVAMIVNLVIAGLFGALVPLVLGKLRQDPALGSSIFVTTATDVGGFLVFLGLASIFIKILLPV
jgi:magnesium transporter